MTGKIVSRIHKYITPKLMADLDKICNNRLVPDNNTKVRMIKEKLDYYDVMYNELGPGTNRFAVSIDGYVFKIAMDNQGKQDNGNEFIMSKELQPFVIKVYENNDLISVSEYVTLMGREEFLDSREDILEILSNIGESYLMGDVGYTEKNFTNWGYRDDGQLVILDFAYIHVIEGREMLCDKDGTMLDYNETFTFLRCPTCSTKYSFSRLRQKITLAKEWEYINAVKNDSYQLTTPSIILDADGEQKNKPTRFEEENDMLNNNDNDVFDLTEEEAEEEYNALFNALFTRRKKKPVGKKESVQEEVVVEDEIEVQQEDEPSDSEVVYVADEEEVEESPADILRDQAQELLETADKVEEAQQVKDEEHDKQLAEVEAKKEEVEDKVYTLEEALNNTDFTQDVEVIVPDSNSTVEVSVVTPTSVTKVEVQPQPVESEDETTADVEMGFMEKMNKVYQESQRRREEESQMTFEIKKPVTPKSEEDEPTDKYAQMAKDLGYDLD